MKISYPEKPVLSYRRTTVEMGAVVEYIKSLAIPKAIKCSAYVMFRNESGNGSKGLNNNYCGFQADSGRWPKEYDELINGVVIKSENGTGKQRAFISFHNWKTSIDMLVERVKARGLYVGGQTHLVTNTVILNAEQLALGYYREWVTGRSTAIPTKEVENNYLSMYKQAEKIF